MTTKTPTLQKLAESIARWQAETFPHATGASAAEHLRRETHELWSEFWYTPPGGVKLTKPDAPSVDYVAEEAADVFFMLVQLSQTVGFDLRDAVSAKFAKNLGRKWKEPDEHGVVEHLEA
jgi:NTP pyrophosphatase (non-canonical NTP hydrolase)